MFLQVSVCPQGGWGGIPACLAGFQAHTQGGSLGGSGPGGSPGPHPRGKLRGIWPRGVSRPTPKGEIEGDLVKAHSQGGSWGGSGWGCLLPGGCLLQGGACSWGVPAPGGVYSWGCLLPGGLPAPSGGRPPDHQTATVADGTHPTGMHSCYYHVLFLKFETRLVCPSEPKDTIPSRGNIDLDFICLCSEWISFRFKEISLHC